MANYLAKAIVDYIKKIFLINCNLKIVMHWYFEYDDIVKLTISGRKLFLF